MLIRCIGANVNNATAVIAAALLRKCGRSQAYTPSAPTTKLSVCVSLMLRIVPKPADSYVMSGGE